ncbi:Na+/H+ antiporter subunit A [Microlunatus parietis]|uniref:Multicomponent Na+:H+ antiporter subunit A n=1 Tax=Microlunatus parietis TaxID=682979 RepID=A0A7Y9ID91_9ACTN|nr:Na+/H+ antiporter subunit A [Microlunatus parietis]NYE74697.1 multicomponent Na+:H+ antiporter subunit A [Microlunatus parietis]
MTLLIAVHFGVAMLAPLLARWLRCRAYFVLALPPLATAIWLGLQGPAVLAGAAPTESLPWIPALGIDLSFRLGILQWVLGLIVSAVGALVLFYCRWYFADEDPAPRTSAVLTAFAGAMLGLVTADDLIVLYVFWELTTVFSYLLIGHKPTRSANRRAALNALIVTTFGGLAMLTGIIMLAVTSGTFSISEILSRADLQLASPVIVAAVILILVGALSKSALVPFHFWLPGAMAAPTPISAYLHAAAMVKAGVYLVALLAPTFAGQPGWRPIVLTLGAVTMIVGAWRALRQYDIKVLLAYGTVSQLGFLVFMCGLGTRSAELAGVAMIISHALFKAALFLIVGIVDRSAGSRDIRRLSGLGRSLPVIAVTAGLASASMAAVPPLIGFVTKEAAFESLTYLADGDGVGIPKLPALLLIAAILVGSSLTVAYSLRFLWGTFATKALPDEPGDPEPTRCRRIPAGFAAAPLILAAASLVGGFLGPQLTAVLEPVAATVPTGHESHGIALWHGFTPPLLMSALVLLVGFLMFRHREWIGRIQATLPRVPDAQETYQWLMRGLDRVAVETTAVTQRGSLPIYLGAIMLVLVCAPGGVLLIMTDFPSGFRIADSPGQVLVAAVMIIAAFGAATARGRMKAVILVGVTGYGVALLFLLHGAPDLALTQILIETVILVVFVLVLRKLPKYFTNRPLHSSRWWRLAIAAAVGFVIAAIAFVASGSRIAIPVSTAFPEAAKDFGYGLNIVNVTLVDIRAWDTMGEISVLVVAATGVASLIFIRTRNIDLTRLAGPRGGRRNRLNGNGRSMVWLRGGVTLSPLKRSLIFEVVTRLLFGTMMVTSVYLLLVGHNAPGGGFAGGMVAGMALVIRYLVGGRHELDEAAPVDAGRLLGIGLIIAGLSTVAPIAVGGRIGQSYDISIAVPWLGNPHLVTSVFFDVGVYLVVIGMMLDLARSLGSGIDQHEEQDRTPAPLGATTAAGSSAAR